MLLIVWHSRTGATQAMAEAAYVGARGEIETRLIGAETASPEDLLAATGYIFACPENLATMSGAMKEFFDRCYYPVLGRRANLREMRFQRRSVAFRSRPARPHMPPRPSLA